MLDFYVRRVEWGHGRGGDEKIIIHVRNNFFEMALND